MNTFRQALQESEFTVTAEIAPRNGASVSQLLEQAEILAEFTDGIQLAETRIEISASAMASLLISAGVDPIPHLNCRNRNRIALHSDLLGLRALGVTSLVLNSGPPLPDAGSNAKPVFDVSCRELIAMANAINEEQWAESDHEFVIGTSATVGDPNPERDVGVLQARASAGARFLMLQPCLDLDVLRRYMQQLVETRLTWNYSVIASLAAPEPASVDTFAQLVRQMSAIPGISGVNLLLSAHPSAAKYAGAAIAASGLRR